jgi:O-antigen ligase
MVLAALSGLVVLAFALVVLDLSPEIILAIVAAGIAIPFLVMRPDMGVQLFVATIFVENIAFLNRSATAVKLAGGLIILGWVFNVGLQRRLNIRFGAVVILTALFLGWNAITIIYAVDADDSILPALTYLQLGVAMCMVGSVIDSVGKMRGVFRAIVFCTTLAAAHGTLLYFLGIEKTSAGVVLNRNAMGSYINIAIVCAYILFQLSPSAAERMWLLIALPTLFLGLALTFSRTGFITALAILMLISYRLAKGRGYIVLGASATMLVIIVSFLPAAFYTRVASIVPSMRHQEETFGIRVNVWKVALRMISDNPITGVGLGNFEHSIPRYGQDVMVGEYGLASHNAYVGVAAEAGIPALILFVLLLGAALRDAWFAARASRQRSEALSLEAIAVEICIVSILIAALTGNAERQKYLFFFLGLAMSVRQMSLALPAGEEAPEASSESATDEPRRFEPAHTT